MDRSRPGGIYNSVQDDWGSRWAWAAHADGTYGPWNVKAQFLQYGYEAVDGEGVDTDVIRTGAYGDPYDVAAEAWIATLATQYTMDIDWGPFSQINFYDNYSYMGRLPTPSIPPTRTSSASRLRLGASSPTSTWRRAGTIPGSPRASA